MAWDAKREDEYGVVELEERAKEIIIDAHTFSINKEPLI